MAAMLFLLTISLFFSSSFSSPPRYGLSYNIDCGGSTDYTDATKTKWISDRFFTGGATSIVSDPILLLFPHEKTLRYFPLSYGKENCYGIQVPSGRFLLRTFTVYANYDGKSHPPSFDASVEGTVVIQWRSPWPDDFARTGAYNDIFVFISDGQADVCLHSVATDPPVIGSLQLFQVDPASYGAASIGRKFILVNFARLTCGSHPLGPGFSNETDLFGRYWQSDSDFRVLDNDTPVEAISTENPITNAVQAPNFFPMILYQSATKAVGGGELEYGFTVDEKYKYLLWFHFAEIDSNVTKPGQRVFNIFINNIYVKSVDIYAEVGSFTAYDWHYIVKGLDDNDLSVRLVSVVGSVVISGLENYALVPADVTTVPEQVNAMQALKKSLGVPDRMGWNGDPCAPKSNVWVGVTCLLNENESALVISEIDLGSQGLKGYISVQISQLPNLVTLNLSSNSLEGTLPSGLGQISLIRLDLSNNRFTGPIPESLATSNLHLLLLNNNSLEGRVPEDLYSIVVHGGSGTINLYGNRGLCGAPMLADCQVVWKKGGLPPRGIIAIGISCVFIFFLGLFFSCRVLLMQRLRNFYNHSRPHDLMSLANTWMCVELESQDANPTLVEDDHNYRNPLMLEESREVISEPSTRPEFIVLA